MKETRTLEYKQEITNTFLKTVSAYANFGTGVIKFGVTDHGETCGIPNPDQACLDLENRINDSISPKPDYSLSINRRTNVITLTVKEGNFKPYLYRGKAFRRSDTATIEVDSLELKRLTLEGSNLYYESLRSRDESLSFAYLEQTLIQKLGIEKLTNDMLRTFGFYTNHMEYNNAAALFADRNSFSGIDAARFGATINEILDRETFSGVSVLKQYDNIITMYRRYYQLEQIEGFERVKVSLIPEAAFREAIANALVHRTWDVNAQIRVEMHPDRIDIISPGGLPSSLTEAEYLRGNISYLRNPVMGNLFFRLNYIEMFGTGIRRINECYATYERKPMFEVFDHSIRVSLPVVTRSYAVSTDGQKVLDTLGNGLQLSSSEIADRLGWRKEKTVKVINSLKSAGCIYVSGNGRGTKYEKK